MLAFLVASMVTAAVVLAAQAAFVWRRRASTAGLSLAGLLVGVAWWSLTYALELSAPDIGARQLWGDLKYAGVATIAPTWFVFVMRYTGHDRLLQRPVLVALAVEPLLLMAILFTPATHDLVRSYPQGVQPGDIPVVNTGPVFWAHLAYVDVVVVAATGVFVVSLSRVSRLYRRAAALLVVAALLPLLVNTLHNFEVGWFSRIDLTPGVFTLSGGVLVWGLFRQRLLRLAPLARRLVVDQMADPVLVLDAYGRVVDVNPAAVAALDRTEPDLVGRRGAELLPDLAPDASVGGTARTARMRGGAGEVEITVRGHRRHYEASSRHLEDARGGYAGTVLVLRDVSDRRAAETRLRRLLAERTRIASALQSGLSPASLPHVPGLSLALRYQPAGDGREIGGDVVDVFDCGQGRWGVVVGDVSGKGAEAAVVTALVRYTVRALAAEGYSPRELLRRLNATLLADTPDERFCTLAFAVARPCHGSVVLDLCLAGHPPPLLVRPDGSVEPVGELGTALGLLEDPDLTEVRLALTPGELLVWFTDGLVEARRDGDLFGDERVATLLAGHAGDCPDAVLDVLDRAAHEHAGGDLGDDLALLAMRATPPPG